MRVRIVTDDYAGFEVQHRYRWWPFWIQTRGTNTHSTLEAAEKWARKVLLNGITEKEFEL